MAQTAAAQLARHSIGHPRMRFAVRKGLSLPGLLHKCGSIAAATLLAMACEGPPIAPTAPTQPPATAPPRDPCASPPYTISGVVKVYGGAPAGGVRVSVGPYPYGVGTRTVTDADGRYSVCGPIAAKIAMSFGGKGYASTHKYNLAPRDQIVDILLQPIFYALVGDGSVSGVIAGDELWSGDDDFDGNCAGRPCKLVYLRYEGCPCPFRAVEASLRWSDPSSELAIYVPHGDVYFPNNFSRPAERFCCASGLTATIALNGDYDVFAIGFERANGVLPAGNRRQAFELTARPAP